MKKLLMSTTMAAMFGAMIPAAQALTTTGSVGVVITVTGSCTVAVTSANATLDYLSGGAASNPVNATGTVLCTNGISYTPSWSALTGTVAGIAYTLTPSGSAVASAQTGTGIAVGFTVAPSAAAGQAGDCTLGASGSGTTTASTSGCTGTVTAGATHLMTITY